MRKSLRTILMLISIVIGVSESQAQVSWQQFQPLNTGNNSLGSTKVRMIQNIGDTVAIGGVGGLSLVYNRQWSGMRTANVSSNEVRDVAMGHDGKMYVSRAWDGVLVVDGPNYTNAFDNYYPLHNNSSNGNSLVPGLVNCIETAPDGKIWFGTEGGGISILDDTNFTTYNTSNSSLLNDTIYDIVFLGNKTYIGTHRGLSIIDSATWNTVAYNNGNNGLSNPHILDLFIDRDDIIWAATYYGLNKFNGSNGFQHFLPTNGLIHNDIREITQDTAGNIWVACPNGISSYNGNTFTNYYANGSIGSIPHDNVTSIHFDKNNILWLGTEENGAMSYDGLNWTLYSLSDAQSHNYLFSVTEDSQGAIWTGTIRNDYFEDEKYAYSKYQNGVWTSLIPKTPAGEKIGFKAYHQLLDDNGRHWISTSDKGVAIETNGIWQIFSNSNSNFPSVNARRLAKGKNGDVWVSSNGGIVKFDAQLNMTIYNTSSSGIADDFVWDVAVDSSGNVWASTGNGISKYNGSTWITYDTSDYQAIGSSGNENSAYRIEVDGDQNVWASIYGNGLVKFDGTTWTHHTTNNGAPTNSAYDLMVDNTGFLWVASASWEGLVSKNVNGTWVNYYNTVHPVSSWHNISFTGICQASNGNIYLTTPYSGLIELSLCGNFNSNISILGDSIFCQGDSTILQANNSPNLTYKWYRNNQILSENSSTISVYNPGNYHVVITDNAWGCVEKSNTQSISVNSNNFNLAFSSNDTLLQSPPFNATFINQTPQLTNYSFLWEFGDGNTSNYYHPFNQYQYNGNYDVKLTASHNITGCKDELTKPNFISATGGNSCNVTANISPSGTAIICKNDSLLLTANTGANYTYQWIFNGILITDADSISYYASQPGHYSVIVDDGNCNAISQPFVLNQYPTNPANIFSTGSLTPCTTDSMELELNSFYSHYQWSTGDTTPSVWINQTGSYWVDVVDQFGCAQTSSQFEISSSFLQAPAICIIGVDSASGKNRVIWERQASNLIDSIVVFRESTLAGVYQRIGSMAYNQSGVFIDQQADPAVRAWRYKLAAVDSCGALSLRSALHKSIHLTINAGLNGSWNLIWDNYVGFPISSYYIYRGTSTTNMQLLAQIPGNLSSFTDLNPPSGNVFYQLEIVKTNGCYPDSIYTKANTNYNTSRSNTASNGGLQPVFLTADFQADITTGTWPVRVQFNDQSSGNPKSWQWTFGDGNGSIEKNPAHTYNNSGTYTVSLKIKNGNYRDSIAKIGYVNVLVNGMVEFKTATELAVYPSPNHGQFVLDIKANGQRNYDARVYNMLGEQVYAQKVEVLNQALIDFDLHHLSKGVYFIVLDNKAESIQRKIIIN